MNESLFTKLNSKVVDLSGTGKGWGSLTPTDIAHALSGEPDYKVSLAILKYCEEGNLRTIVRGCLQHIKFKAKSPGLVQKMIGIAIYEQCGIFLCPTCLGHGKEFINHSITDCGGCKGTGRKPLKDPDIANEIGVSETEFIFLRGEYSNIFNKVGEWIRQAEYKLGVAFND